MRNRYIRPTKPATLIRNTKQIMDTKNHLKKKNTPDRKIYTLQQDAAR
ncbi:hypothetical protein [Methanolobus sp. WCC5]|jgi:hypothetical protein